MKKMAVLLLMCMSLTFAPVISVNAQSLDDLINDEPTSEYVSDEEVSNSESVNDKENVDNTQKEDSNESNESNDGNGNYVDEMKDATDLSKPAKGASKLNEGIKKIASLIVQVLSYFATACLVLRVLIDIIYIVLPFTRSFLANGYAGNPQSQGTAQQGMGGMNGMGGMGGYGGMGGMGMGGYGSSRYGMGGMGMGGMSGMGMGGMNAMQQSMSQPGASPAMGRIQWVSTAALNAAAAETVMGPNGKAISPLKAYAKDMIVVLVLTPIFLVLAVTGVLTNLGFFVGEIIAKLISSIGGMM